MAAFVCATANYSESLPQGRRLSKLTFQQIILAFGKQAILSEAAFNHWETLRSYQRIQAIDFLQEIP